MSVVEDIKVSGKEAFGFASWVNDGECAAVGVIGSVAEEVDGSDDVWIGSEGVYGAAATDFVLDFIIDVIVVKVSEFIYVIIFEFDALEVNDAFIG